MVVFLINRPHNIPDSFISLWLIQIWCMAFTKVYNSEIMLYRKNAMDGYRRTTKKYKKLLNHDWLIIWIECIKLIISITFNSHLYSMKNWIPNSSGCEAYIMYMIIIIDCDKFSKSFCRIESSKVLEIVISSVHNINLER